MRSESDSRFQPTFHSQRGGFNPSLELLTLGILLGSVFIQALAAIHLNTNLQAGDQGAYLHLSLAQTEGRKLTDGNRHPLYSALLLPIAERDARFFSRARWFSCLVGMALLCAIAWLEWRRRGDRTAALVALAFLAAHVQMLRTLSEIWCEPLLYLLVFLLWWKTDEWGGTTQETDGKRRRGFFILGGVLAGLAYLTKGTGLQVAVLFIVTLLFFGTRRRKVLIPIGLFLVVASPLLAWNLSVYGNPLHSFASTHNMWFDEADEIWYEDAEELPTLGSYLRSHSRSEIFARLFRGLYFETKMAGQLLWSDWRLPASGDRMEILLPLTLFKIFLVTLVLIGIGFSIRSKRDGEPIASKAGWTYFFLMMGFFFLAFGWYAQLTDAPRFLMTLVPIFVVLGARFVSRTLVSAAGAYPWVPRLVRWTLLVYALSVFTWSASFAWRTRAVPGPVLAPVSQRVLERLNDLPEGSKIAYGPSHGLPLWLSRGDLVWRATPWRVGWERFLAMLEREEIEYVLVDSETIARRPYLGPLSQPGVAEELGWRLVFRVRGEFMLYQIEDGADEE